MSVYIKGMEMPKDGWCTITVRADGVVVLNASKENGEYFSHNNKTIGEAIPVPDHGRLIDADANIATLKECADNPENDMARICYNYAVCILNACPTIIPADKEDGE